jgi:DNA invertase Pin-like site-specific DNA recombinase
MTAKAPRCKLVAYYRVSTAKQGQSGLGLEGQQAAVEAYSKATGCRIITAYTEVESGKRADRPELAKAIAHAKRAGACLTIAKLDRLARNVHFLSGLLRSGVDFVACDNATANKLTIHILAAVAEDEAERISERTKAALAAYKARGGHLGGYRPNAAAKLTAESRAKGNANAVKAIKERAVDAYADLTPMMQTLRAEGQSLAAIADRLNQEGHTTRTCVAWSAVQVMRALKRSEG